MKRKIQKNWLEWAVFGIAAVLIALVLAFLGYEAALIGDALPDIQLQIGKAEARSGYFAVPIELMNKGDQTAEAVHIEVTLRVGGTEEKSDIEIQFLPRRGQREAWVTFKNDPSKGSLEGRVLGYEKP